MTILSRGALLVFALLLVAPHAATAQPREAWGVVTSIQFLDNVGEPGLARLQQLGNGSVRIGIDWKEVQPNPGDFNFTNTDTWIANARASGMQIFASLGEPPAWAAACTKCVPYDMGQWYTYVRTVIQRYSGYGHNITYGIWNEPNDTKFLKTSPSQQDSNPQSIWVYNPIAIAAFNARNDSGTGARFAMPDSTPAAASNGWMDGFQSLIAPSMAPQDIVAVHWYPGNGVVSNYMQSIVNRFGGRETWLTEWGPSTPTSDQAQMDNIAMVSNAFRIRSPSLGAWTRLFYYRLWDDAYDKEALLRPDWSTRPGFDTYKVYISFTNPPPPPPSAPSELTQGQKLDPGGELRSPDNRFRFTYQVDGNVVLYQGGDPIWWSGTMGSGANGELRMQTDGNLVLYVGSYVPFHTFTYMYPGAKLKIQNDGNAVIYDATGQWRWQSGTCCR